jgi:uncharacterized protein YbbC (DUF1343 family)
MAMANITLTIPTLMITEEKFLGSVFFNFLASKKAKFIFSICSLLFIFNVGFSQILPAADQPELYLKHLKGKNVALVVNGTSNIGKTHLVDYLISKKINIKALFAPEHGFRGEVSAGENISNQKDKKTGLNIFSLYGKSKKPSSVQLKNVDIVVFDIQDVGVRFYTYISTLYYVMQACAEENKPLLILDRPNPNIHRCEGPVLEKEFESFVGIIPIPLVYGMSIGELGQMINGENWLKTKNKCSLHVIKVKNYSRNSPYLLPIKPSPNLPNALSIDLYPSLCLLEPTVISVGRGTNLQFQVLGGTDPNYGQFSFIPTDKPGAINPVNEGKKCYGIYFEEEKKLQNKFTLSYLWDFYKKCPDKSSFFSSKDFFKKLCGNAWILEDLEKEISYELVEKKWENELNLFREKRIKYLLYE